MIRRALWVLAVIAISGVVRLVRVELDGVPNPIMAAWPGQVIFGFYFTILVLAAQALHSHRTAGEAGSPEQRLLLLAMAGVCLDLVLVNVAETVGPVDASYGVVVLWDIVTFFAWMRAVELGKPGEETTFERSATVAMAPALKLGRELLFVPYGSASARAYFDLFFADVLLCLWAFGTLDRVQPAGVAVRRFAHASRIAVFFVGGYWLCNAAENTAFLAWSPLSPALEAFLARHGIPSAAISTAYIVISATATFVAWRFDALGIGTRFGLRPAPLTSSSPSPDPAALAAR